MPNLQTHRCLKLDFQIMDKHTVNQWILSCKAWNSPVEYPSWEYKFDIKESVGNMSNSVIINKVQGQKSPGRWVVAELK